MSQFQRDHSGGGMGEEMKGRKKGKGSLWNPGREGSSHSSWRHLAPRDITYGLGQSGSGSGRAGEYVSEPTASFPPSEALSVLKRR